MVYFIFLVPCNRPYYNSLLRNVNYKCVITDEDKPSYIRNKLLGVDLDKATIYRANDNDKIDNTWRPAFPEEIENLKKRRHSSDIKNDSITSKKLLSFPLAGKTVKVKESGEDYCIEDWWYNVNKEDWRTSVWRGNPAAWNYFMKHQFDFDHPNAYTNRNSEKVLYGKIGGLGYLMNVIELELPENTDTELIWE